MVKNKRILFVHNSTGSRLYRILPQAKHMAKLGWDTKVRGLRSKKTGAVTDELLQWADIVVVEMTYSPKFIKACKKAGCKVVYECDDLMEYVTKDHYAHKEMNWWRTFLTYWVLTQVDVVTVTSEKLKQRYKWFNQNIHVLPNYLDLEYWEKPYLDNTSDTIRLGWIGGNSHKEDLRFIKPVIKSILKKNKNVKFVATGFGGKHSDNPWTEFDYGEALFKDLPQGQYEFSLGTPMEVFASKIPAMRLDIGIAPVVKNKFAEAKSNCKSLEYGINRIPAVYSDFLYRDSVVDGVTGLLAKEDLKEWEKKIQHLIDNTKEERQHMGSMSRALIRDNFNFERHVQKWAQVYESLI